MGEHQGHHAPSKQYATPSYDRISCEAWLKFEWPRCTATVSIMHADLAIALFARPCGRRLRSRQRCVYSASTAPGPSTWSERPAARRWWAMGTYLLPPAAALCRNVGIRLGLCAAAVPGVRGGRTRPRRLPAANTAVLVPHDRCTGPVRGRRLVRNSYLHVPNRSRGNNSTPSWTCRFCFFKYEFTLERKQDYG